MSKVWFITGTSRGFGREFAIAALDRGDLVAATARSTDSLKDLVEEYGDAILPLELDVTDRGSVKEAVAAAHGRFGRLDVVVNNAGYGQFGAAEEVSETELRDQMETNFFGAVAVTQEVLPILREQGSGHVVQVSSIGGIAAFQNVSAYHASKWALEGWSDSLSQEVAPFGIKVTIVEPGGFSTDWGGSSAKHATEMTAYDGVRESNKSRRGTMQPGDPEATRGPILELVDADEPPLRVFFGDAPLEISKQVYERRLQTWADWAHVAHAAQG